MAARFALGLFVLLMFIGGVAWVMWSLLKKSYDPSRLAFRWILTAGVIIGGYFSVDFLAGDGSAGGKIAGVLMGLILAGHGAIAFIYTAISAAIARRIVAH